MENNIRTERMILREAVKEDLPEILDFYVRNKEYFEPFDPVREEAFFTMKEQKRLLKEDQKASKEGRMIRFYLFDRNRPGKVMGMVNLSNIVRGAFQSCFVGYKIDSELANKGYMTEGLRAVTDYAFKELGLHRVEANVMPRNIASVRVAEKCGYKHEGLAIKYLRIAGVWEDHIHYVKLNFGI